jgi:hypothetical protein
MLAEQAWQEMLAVPQIAIIMGCLIPIGGIVAFYWYKVQKARSDNELKRTMIDRGLSADEIERILAAQAAEPRSSRR